MLHGTFYFSFHELNFPEKKRETLVAVEAWLPFTNQMAAIATRPGRLSHRRKPSREQLGEGQ